MKTKKQKCIFVLSFLLALSLLFFLLTKQLETNRVFYGESSIQQEGTQIASTQLYEQKDVIQIEQSFEAKASQLSQIKIYFSITNYGEIVQNKDKVRIGIMDDKGNLIHEENIQYTHYLAQENAYLFTFPQQIQSRGKEYHLYIQMQQANMGINFLKQTNTSIPVQINGKQIENTVLKMKDYYQDTIAMRNTYIAFWTIGVISTLIAVMLYERPTCKPEQVFLYVVPFFCILFTLVMPISKGHDETIHWYKVYEQAEGRFLGTQEQVYLPKGVIQAFQIEDIQTKETSYTSIFEEKEDTIDDQRVTLRTRTATYSPITYLPQIISVKITSLFINNATILAYIARLSNIVVCLLLLYKAIKIIPYGKNVILLISLIPIAIEGFSTISADGMTISSSILLISYILKLREERQTLITGKQIAILGVLSVVVAISKTVYLPLVGMLFLLPKEKFQSTKKKNLILVGLLSVAALVDIGWYFMNGLTTTAINNAAIIQKGILMTDPIGTIQLFLYTMISRFSIYFNEVFGGKLGWNEYVDILMVPYLLAFTLFAVSICGKEKKTNFSVLEKIGIGMVVIAIIGLVFLAMFIEWSVPGLEYIAGVQGRYLIPILLPICLLLGGKFLDTPEMSRNIGIAALYLQIYVIISIMVYHI